MQLMQGLAYIVLFIAVCHRLRQPLDSNDSGEIKMRMTKPGVTGKQEWIYEGRCVVCLAEFEEDVSELNTRSIQYTKDCPACGANSSVNFNKTLKRQILND